MAVVVWKKDLAVGPVAFMIFWFWVVVMGLKGVVRRMGQLGQWLCTPWGNNDDLLPTMRGSIGQSWSDDEYRHYTALAKQSAIPAVPDVMQGMQDALAQEKQTAERLGRDIAEWQHAIDQLKLQADDWAEKAATALSKGRNDLARAAITERHRAVQRATELESDVAEMRRLLTSHSSDIQNLETKLSTIYRRNHMAETRLSAAQTSARARQLLYGEQVKDSLSRFEQLERAADLAEGHAESLALGSKESLDALSLEAELAAMRPPSGFGRKRIAS